MGGSIVKKVSVVYGLVLALVLRAIIPFTARSNALAKCPQCTTAVITYYSGISSTLFVIATLLLLSIRLADLTADWISVAYIPLLMFMIRWPSYASVKQLKNMEDSYDAFVEDLSQHWWSYFNNNDTYWPDLEKKLQCCGFEGPRCYMDYMRKVPEHCYNPQLITLGCEQLFHDIFRPMQGIGHIMSVITLFMEVGLLYLHAFIVYKKLVSWIAGRNRKRVSKPSLCKSN